MHTQEKSKFLVHQRRLQQLLKLPELEKLNLTDTNEYLKPLLTEKNYGKKQPSSPVDILSPK